MFLHGTERINPDELWDQAYILSGSGVGSSAKPSGSCSTEADLKNIHLSPGFQGEQSHHFPTIAQKTLTRIPFSQEIAIGSELSGPG